MRRSRSGDIAMKVGEEGQDNLPPGFRFHPTDEELITHYLLPKVLDKSFCSIPIADVDINKCEPWHLPGKASMGGKEWYFFSTKHRKYPTGMRTNRATESGYWKTTGKDKEIFRGNTLVGMKKTLVFYKGRAPRGVKSNWVMHEYRLENKRHLKITNKGEWVVCRVLKKPSIAKKPPENTPSSPASFDSNDAYVREDHRLENIAKLSNPVSNNASSLLQNCVTRDSINNIFHNNDVPNKLGYVNLPSLREGVGFPPLSLFPSISGLLGSNLGTSSLVKALQMGANQLISEISSINYSVPREIAHFGQDLGTNIQASSTIMIMPQAQQQEQSVWGSFVSDDVV